ncbi:MAG: double-strand break repair protein AddB [Paenirhodobacter sp.]|uniref:double-strand break repair protein AddB n=1 Tax=Paenirhodobacter sp. TaxID=1965326 RepID=UPI003D12ADD2
MAEAHVFALPPGVDFPRELVVGLITRMQGEPPEAMARVRLYLNSGRMQRRVREEFDRHGARFLPRLALVSDLARQPLSGLAPAVPPLRRRLELARLTAELMRSLPSFEAGAGAFGLARSLGQLMAEMQTEGVTPDTLERLDVAENHAEHWRRSLDFIRIVARYFEADAHPDAEARQRLAIENLAAEWQHSPTTERIIVAGSTGSRGATALFMQAVATLPNGMIVLPGVDFSMPDHAWNSLYSSQIPLEDHPQYRFLHLLRALSLTPGDLKRWTETPPHSAGRNALISLALRPAPVTDQWMQEGQQLGDLGPACADVSLIEASDPRQEATALALALREAAETGQSAALITPDRLLARRVAAMLDRWGIIPDDSAGEPLQQTAPGRFLRHIARLQGRRLTIEALLVLLKHPLTATGSTLRGHHLRFTRELELHLRRQGPAFPDAATLSAWTEGKDPEQTLWASWLGAFIMRFEPSGDRSISAWLETHLSLAETLAAGPAGAVEASELWLQEPGRACARIMADLQMEAEHGGLVSASDYTDLIDGMLGEEQVRATAAAHPGIAILGTLEARVHGHDLVILGGLNEGIWPAAPAPDPWLSRKMRLDSGLLLPERQIGLSAHDFQQAIAARQVILSRARRDSDAETVPSRWLNRFTNLLGGLAKGHGPEALEAMRARGSRYLRMAMAVDRPDTLLPAQPRPAPRPPVEVRPRELPVTAIKTLIRDPYAIYARRILRLRPLDPLRPEPDARLRGQVLHEIVELFVRQWHEEEPEAAVARLMALAQEVLETRIPWPSAQRLWLARIGRIAMRLVEDEAARRARGRPALIEKSGSVSLENMDFTLNAKPDRIDILQDGTAHLFDYKSGKPPSDAEVLHFDKQLLLEAAMILRGAFADIGPREVSAMTYLRLGGAGETRDLGFGAEEIRETWDKLGRLIARYGNRAQGYAARRALQHSLEQSDYDHLSRFGEWELSDRAKGEDVG